MLSRIAADRMWGLFWCEVIHHDVLMMVAVGTRPLPFLLLIHPFSLTCFWLLTRSPHLVTRDNDNTCPQILYPILHDNSLAGEGQGATWGERSTALYCIGPSPAPAAWSAAAVLSINAIYNTAVINHLDTTTASHNRAVKEPSGKFYNYGEVPY